MTTVRLDNGSTTQASKYYIRLYTTSIDEAIDKRVVKLNIPRAKSNWSSGVSRVSFDFLDVDRKFVVKAMIDETSNKTSGWAAADVANALIVKERILYMIEHGGVLTLTIGLIADGYDSDRTYSVHVDRVVFTEMTQDQLVAPNYQLTMECSVSTDR